MACTLDIPFGCIPRGKIAGPKDVKAFSLETPINVTKMPFKGLCQFTFPLSLEHVRPKSSKADVFVLTNSTAV